MKLCLVVLLTSFTMLSARAQEVLQMYITGNANLYLPRNSDKQTYPVLGYSGDADPKVLVGGLGGGLLIMKNFNAQFLWRAQSNTSRRAYWNEPMTFTDNSNVTLGNVVCKGVDIVQGLTGTVHYRFSEVFTAGTGLGLDVLIYSYSRLPDKFTNKTFVSNGYYKPLVPLIPLELSLSFNKILVNLRYQHALINRLKSPIADHQQDNYSALIVELGYKIN